RPKTTSRTLTTVSSFSLVQQAGRRRHHPLPAPGFWGSKVNASDLIDPTAVHKFVALVHARAAAAIAGMGDPRRPVLHLCSAAPDDARFFHSAYNIGDVEHMAADALIDTAAGRNVFVEPRLCRPGLPHERGRLEATLAVFASVADGDADTGKPF